MSTNPLAGVHNYAEPDWAPLERAMALLEMPPDNAGNFMWMCENPAGTHQYKHYDTRNYAMLRADSTLAECQAELAIAESLDRTWGKQLDRRLAR